MVTESGGLLWPNCSPLPDIVPLPGGQSNRLTRIAITKEYIVEDIRGVLLSSEMEVAWGLLTPHNIYPHFFPPPVVSLLWILENPYSSTSTANLAVSSTPLNSLARKRTALSGMLSKQYSFIINSRDQLIVQEKGWGSCCRERFSWKGAIHDQGYILHFPPRKDFWEKTLLCYNDWTMYGSVSWPHNWPHTHAG